MPSGAVFPLDLSGLGRHIREGSTLYYQKCLMVRYACDSPFSRDAFSRSLPGSVDAQSVLVLNSKVVPALHVTRTCSVEHDIGFATHSHNHLPLCIDPLHPFP
jgi:hypothetical protein